MGVPQWLSFFSHWRRKWPTTTHRRIHYHRVHFISTHHTRPSARPTQRIFALFLMCLLVLPSFATESWDEVRWNYEDYSQVTRVPLDPIFLATKQNITVREGGNAALPCKIQHQGTKRVAWRRVDLDRFLTIGTLPWDKDRNLEVKHVKPSEDLDEWTLILPQVSKKDAGLYECQVTSVTGYHTLVKLNVVGPRLTQPAVHMSGTRYVERGDEINLTCNATGGNHTADDVDWFKDGNIIGSGKDYVILKYTMIEQGALVSTLHVDRAKAKHAGTYVCRSSHNKLGSISVQVLVADSSNWKRDFHNPPGTVSSSNSSASSLAHHSLQQVTVYIIILGIVINRHCCFRSR